MPTIGFNAATGDYEDLVKSGVIDPTKVTRSALQHAASISALMLTTEAMICEIPEKKSAAGRPAATALRWITRIRLSRKGKKKSPLSESLAGFFGVVLANPASLYDRSMALDEREKQEARKRAEAFRDLAERIAAEARRRELLYQ